MGFTSSRPTSAPSSPCVAGISMLPVHLILCTSASHQLVTQPPQPLSLTPKLLGICMRCLILCRSFFLLTKSGHLMFRCITLWPDFLIVGFLLACLYENSQKKNVYIHIFTYLPGLRRQCSYQRQRDRRLPSAKINSVTSIQTCRHPPPSAPPSSLYVFFFIICVCF